MAFLCPECNSDALDLIASMELPPDAQSDEITIEIWARPDCRFQGVSVYEESRRGAWDSDSWHRSGYRLSEQALAMLIKSIKRCPKPDSRQCGCRLHRRQSQTGPGGTWDARRSLGEITGFWDVVMTTE
jgi:hypothetical protein